MTRLTDENFVAIISDSHIYKAADGSFQAVRRTTHISQKVGSTSIAPTLLEVVLMAMNGEKLASNQLQRVREAVTRFARQELSGYFFSSRSSRANRKRIRRAAQPITGKSLSDPRLSPKNTRILTRNLLVFGQHKI